VNLYRIIVLHGAPKDSHTSTETYLVAESEDAVMAWIDKTKNFDGWAESDSMRYADDSCEKEIPFKEWVMLKRGDLEDEEGWEDSYYGVTKWGWEPITATPEEITVLIKLGIAFSTEVKP
jgi:hypothetical protein